MWAAVKVFGVLLLAIILPRLAKFTYQLGYGKHIFPHEPGPCRVLPLLDEGSEDIELLPGGKAFISSGLRFLKADDDPVFSQRRGRIHMFDFNQPHLNTSEVELDWAGTDGAFFNPHGLSSWTDPDTGEIFLYVVNHLPDFTEAIDSFIWQPHRHTLLHRKRITDQAAFTHLNDLVVVDIDAFFFTNFLYMPSYMLEMSLRLHWGSVGFYDDHGVIDETGSAVGAADVIISRMLAPNGIAMSPDGKYVYVAYIGDQELRVYEREGRSGLHLVQSFPVYSSMDNLYVERVTGAVWAAGHPIRHRNVFPRPHAPPASQVLRISTKDGLLDKATEVYADDGDVIQGSSIAVHYGGGMLVGTVAHRCLYCQVLH